MVELVDLHRFVKGVFGLKRAEVLAQQRIFRTDGARSVHYAVE